MAAGPDPFGRFGAGVLAPHVISWQSNLHDKPAMSPHRGPAVADRFEAIHLAKFQRFNACPSIGIECLAGSPHSIRTLKTKGKSMLFQIKVRVNLAKMAEFGQKLQKGELDRSAIRGETHCLRDDPAVGFSIWEAGSRAELDEKFAPWLEYYADADISEVVTPQDAMGLLFDQLRRS